MLVFAVTSFILNTSLKKANDIYNERQIKRQPRMIFIILLYLINCQINGIAKHNIMYGLEPSLFLISKNQEIIIVIK